jgi:hypothetical protein
MRDDDEIIEAYEQELSEEAPARGRNRGFWLVLGTLLVVCVFVVVEIFANLGVKDTIAHAQHSLRAAESAATAVFDDEGSYRDATADELLAEGLTFVDGQVASTGLDVVSVEADDDGWAAAVQVRPGACFYIRLTDDPETFYGVGTTCTGEEATGATDSRW